MLKVCTPYYERIESECSDSVNSLLDSMGGKAKWATVRGTLIADSRNVLVNDAKSYEARQKIVDKYDGYLFVDSDIAFTVEDAERILNSGKDIISGVYKSRFSGVDQDLGEEYACG